MVDITLKKISELDSIENINNNDLILISRQDDTVTDTFISKKIDFNALSTNILSSTATKINSLSNTIHDSVVRFSNYPTESKAGVVRVGTGLTLSSNGSINVDIGSGLSVSNNKINVISVDVGVKTISNGANITIDDDDNGNYTIRANVGVKTIDGRTPDNYGDVNLDNIRSLIPNAVDISAVYSVGTKIALLSVGNVVKPIYIPTKDTITVSPYYDAGINLGKIEINQLPFNIFMPTSREPTYTLLAGSTKFGLEVRNPGTFTANTSWCNSSTTATQTLVGSEVGLEYNWTYLDNGTADTLFTKGGVRYYWKLTEPWTSFDTLLVEFGNDSYYPGSHRLDVKYLIRLALQLLTAYPYDTVNSTAYKFHRSINLIGDGFTDSAVWRIELVASYLAEDQDRLYDILSQTSYLHAIYGLRN